MDVLRVSCQEFLAEGGETVRLARRILGEGLEGMAVRCAADPQDISWVEAGEAGSQMSLPEMFDRLLVTVATLNAALRALNHELGPMEVFLAGVRTRRQKPDWGIVRRTADGRASLG